MFFRKRWGGGGWGLGNFLKHEFFPLWVMHDPRHDFFWYTIAYKRSFFK